MMIKHVLFSLIAIGSFFAFCGFVLTMFGFSSPCNEQPQCSGTDSQRILLYKICGPIMLVFGVVMVVSGITLKWKLQSEHLQLDGRALSAEGTAFTGDTNLNVPQSPVEETPPSPTGMMVLIKLDQTGSGLLGDGTDSGGGDKSYLSSSKGFFSQTWDHQPPVYSDYAKYPNYPTANDVTYDDETHGDGLGYDEVDACRLVGDSNEAEKGGTH